jgi:hypothetical protein
LLIAAASGLLSLGQAPTPANGGTANYSTLYLSSATSTLLTSSYTLVTTAGPASGSAPVVSATGVGPLVTGTYNYAYTKAGPVGESAVSGTSSSVTTANGKSILVSSLPTGVTVYLYRQFNNGYFNRVATLTNNSVSTYTDSMDNVTAAGQPTLPLTQSRVAVNSPAPPAEYQDFSPGQSAPLLTPSATDPGPLTTPNGKGWIVDGEGGVSFPASTWTFGVRFIDKDNPALGTAHLSVGMWKVTTSGSAITSSTLLIDPSCAGAAGCGENPANTPANNLIGGNPKTISDAISVGAFSLQSNEHLYVEYFRHQTVGMTGNSGLATMLVYDGMSSSITLPAATPVPDVPTLVSPTDGTRTNNTTPQLRAKYYESDGNTGTLSFRVCSASDSSCTAPVQTGSAAGLASGANGSWTPAALSDGRYYWEVQATDSAAHQSTWSSPISFTVDTVPPGTPTLDSPAVGARVNSTQIGATFVDSDSTDSGTVSYQLCSNASCSTVVASGTSAIATANSAVAMSPGSFADGTYYWRLRATDVAGNPTASWTPTQSFVLDTNPPGVPALVSPADGAYLGAGVALSGIFSSGDAGDNGMVEFQVCSDIACGSVLGSGQSSSGLLNGATGSWTATGMVQGTNYWRARAQDAAGNQSAWSATRSFTYDTTAPTAPGPGSVTARAQTAPQLSSTFADPGASDAGTLLFQVCSNSGCTAVVQSHTVSGVANNTTVNWTPSSLADGLYYYKVTAMDAAGNTSSSSGSFTVDTVAPAKPALGSPGNAARVNTAQLNATFTNSDPTDGGTVTFQRCSDATCTSVLGTFTSGTVVSGGAVSWTPTLPDGTYYWRASSLDAAGNQGAWSSVRSFVLDTNPPNVVSLAGPADGAHVGAAPTLKGTFSSADAGDSGSIFFQVCSDSSCTAVVTSGWSAAGLADTAVGSWKPSGLADGVYYWRAQPTDAAGNTQTTWSSIWSFTLDTTPPAPPTTTGSLVDAVRLNQPPTLTAVYNDSGGGTGSLEFELCATISCTTPILTSTGATGSLAAGATGSWKPTFLFDGLYFWHVRSVDSAGNASGWSSVLSFSVDATSPEAPVLSGANGMRVPGAPALAARVSDPTDPGDEARIFVEVCGDATCATILASGYSGTVPVGSLAGWQAPDLGSGTYYWRALAEDVVGNRSEWSAARTFVVDTVPPAVPLQGGVSEAALVSRPRLSGTFSDQDAGDSGTLEFQVCADADCATVVAHGSSATVAAGQTGSWTAVETLDDGVYFWRVRAVDVAGNGSAWSSTRSFTLDQTPPGQPQDFSAQVTGQVLTLTWRPPAGSGKVRGYALIVNGKKTRTLDAKTLKLKIQLLKHDKRSFAVAAIDPAGNMSEATRTIATFKVPLSLKQARSAALRRHS